MLSSILGLLSALCYALSGSQSPFLSTNLAHDLSGICSFNTSHVQETTLVACSLPYHASFHAFSRTPLYSANTSSKGVITRTQTAIYLMSLHLLFAVTSYILHDSDRTQHLTHGALGCTSTDPLDGFLSFLNI